MKFGVREICDVVLKAKSSQKIGNKTFYKNEPVIYFDTLKTSSMEGAATTVYAQGGRGNSRLMAWEGERTVTFTMEDALISPEGFMILSGAGLIEASKDKPVFQHVTERVDASSFKDGKIPVSKKPYLPYTDSEKNKEYNKSADGNYAFIMFVKDDEIISEPYVPSHEELEEATDESGNKIYYLSIGEHKVYDSAAMLDEDASNDQYYVDAWSGKSYDSVIVDYYVAHEGGAMQIEITPDKFGGNFYLEASTLFRDTNGIDMPAEFIIPNCKIQSNFNFTMASSGDPSTFTFTMDAFPDYTRFDRSKKVLAAIQVIKTESAQDLFRMKTDADFVTG